MFVDKVNARRYWFSKAPVATDDLTTDKGWVSNTSDWTYNATGDYIDFATIRRSTTAQQIYIEAVWRLDPTSNGHNYNNVICGMASQTNDNGSDVAHYQIMRQNTYIKYRTRSGGTGNMIDSSVATDEAFHHTKIQAKSASSYEFSRRVYVQWI